MIVKVYETSYFCQGYDNSTFSATYEDAVKKAFHIDDVLADGLGGILEAEIYEVEYEVDITQRNLNEIMSSFHGNICRYMHCNSGIFERISCKKLASMTFPQE
jgi:hypothetical protein